MDCRDVGMIQPAGNLRLSYKASDGALIGRPGRGQELQRDLALQADVFGEIDDAQTPGAKGCFDTEVIDKRPGGDGQYTCSKVGGRSDALELAARFYRVITEDRRV
jgi:hypothetical protein